MEFIDYLFIFWFSLTIAVVFVGDFIHKQINNNKSASSTKQDALKDRYNNFVGDNWFNNSTYNQQGINYESSYNKPNYSNQYNNYEHNYTSNNNVPINNNNSAQAYSTQIYGDNYEQRRASYLGSNQYTGNSQFRGDVSFNSPSSSTGIYETSGNYNNSFVDRFGSSMDDQYHALNKDNTIPTATGFNSDCVEWVNNILYLFYTQTEKYGSIIIESVYRSLNEKLSNITSSSAEYSDLMIQFVGVNRDLSTKPDLTNIRTETESEKSVSAICKIYNKRSIFYLSIAPRVSRSQFSSNTTIDPILQEDHYSGDGGSKQSQEYELILENLEGKLKSVAMLSEKLIVIQFMEKPDTKILLKPRFKDFNSKPLINEDTLVSIILQTLTQVVVDLFFGDDPDFPHYKGLLSNTSGYRNKLNILKGSANEIKQHIKHDFFGALTSSFESKERKIFVKILKANNINYNQNVTCLLELDTPYQQALSSTKQGSNPFWDEHFLFNINEKSNELLIELWDSINIPVHHHHNDSLSRKKNASSFGKNNKKWSKSEVTSTAKFLGLARINIDELRRDPVQKVNLMLQSQSKPEQRGTAEAATEFIGSGLQVGDLSNSVGGELQVELLFLEHSSTNHSGEKQHSSIKKSNSVNSLTYQQGDVVSIDRKLTPSGYVIRTTTITKTPNQQQLQQLKQQQQQQQQQSRFDQLSVRNQSPAISSTSEQSDLDINLDAISSSQMSADNQSRGLNQDQQSQGGHHRSRSRSRSRSFLRAIKKRFSFSRTRSRSVGEAVTSGSRSPSVLRDHDAHSTGIDGKSIESRSRASSDASIGRAKSVPASRDPNEVPIIVINKSRLSDTASAFTFTHPKSQLVIECTEPKLCADGSVKQNGQLRHYLIPDDAINKRKWSKRGLKLHVFNEHQFIACHLAGSSTCHLCGKVFSRRPGKQGYKCRNCHLLSHKQCHVKVDHNCPYATKDGLNLEYIDADPPYNLVEDVRASSSGSGTLPRQQQQQQKSKRPMKLAAKSISMEVDDR